MRTFTFAIVALAFAGIATPAVADGFNTVIQQVPVNGRSITAICRAVDRVGILPSTVAECVRDTQGRLHDETPAMRASRWAPVQVVEGPRDPTAQSANGCNYSYDDSTPTYDQVRPAANVPRRPFQPSNLGIGLIMAALIAIGYFVWLRLRPKPKNGDGA